MQGLTPASPACAVHVFKGYCGARSTLCDPYLNLFRGIIPPIGGTLDLSPILAFVVLDVSLHKLTFPGLFRLF